MRLLLKIRKTITEEEKDSNPTNSDGDKSKLQTALAVTGTQYGTQKKKIPSFQ